MTHRQMAGRAPGRRVAGQYEPAADCTFDHYKNQRPDGSLSHNASFLELAESPNDKNYYQHSCEACRQPMRKLDQGL